MVKLDAKALEAACKAYARRWMPSEASVFTFQARSQVEYIIRAYLEEIDQGSPSPSQTTAASSEPQTAASEAINGGNVDLNEWARLNGYAPSARGGPDWVTLYEDEHGKGSWNRR